MMEDLGKRLFDLRKAHGLTLEQVGQAVGVGRSTVRKWENGIIANMRRDKIKKLADVLETTPAYIMGWTDDPEYDDDDGGVDPAIMLMCASRPSATRQLVALKGALEQLNEEGREKLLDYAADLVASGRYIKTDQAGLGQKKA